jgi:TPR repeat protein
MANASLLSIRRPCRAAILLAVFVLLAVSAAGAGPMPEETKSRPTSFEGWLPLAEAGDAEAQCNIGVAYLNGNKAAQDFAKGLAWLSRSSDAGFGYARYVLADVYSRGYAGVPASDEKAYYYATLAAASSSLSEKYRDKAAKIRDASAKRLTPAQITRVQASTALAPLDAVASGS